MNTLAEKPTSIWSQPVFRTLFFTAFFASLGSTIYKLALPLLVYEISGSAEMMGWMRAVEFLPNLLLAMFIGAWVDRFNRKRWSQWMLIGQIACLIAAYLAVEWLTSPLWVLFPAAFLMTTFDYGYHNARMGIFKNVLPTEQQNTATARMSSLYNFFDTLGPALSGILLLLSAIHNVFLLVIMIYLLAYLQFSKLRFETPTRHTSSSTFQAIKQGWEALKNNTCMWHITLAVMIINTTGAVFSIQSIFYAKSALMLSSAEVGYIVASAGIGGLLGSLIADRLRRMMGLGHLLISSIFLESIGFIFIVVIPSSLTLSIAFFWVSFIGVMSNICIWSYRQEAFDEHVMGRVAGITGSLFKLLMPIGLALSGYAVTMYGINNIFITCSVFQSVTAAALLFSQVKHLK